MGEVVQHTPGPLMVVLDGTLTGISAEIQSADRTIGETEVVYVRREDCYPQNNPECPDWGSFDETPEQYELTEDGAEALANAHLWAAAPELLEAAQILASLEDPEFLGSGRRTPTKEECAKARAAISKALGQDSSNG